MIKYKYIQSYLVAISILALLKFWEIYICELCYSDILFNYTIYACMLADQLNIFETGLPIQFYAFT